MPELPRCGFAQGGRLLRVLQLRHGAMSAYSGGYSVLRLNAGFVGAAKAVILVRRDFAPFAALLGSSFWLKAPFLLGLLP